MLLAASSVYAQAEGEGDSSDGAKKSGADLTELEEIKIGDDEFKLLDEA